VRRFFRVCIRPARNVYIGRTLRSTLRQSHRDLPSQISRTSNTTWKTRTTTICGTCLMYCTWQPSTESTSTTAQSILSRGSDAALAQCHRRQPNTDVAKRYFAFNFLRRTTPQVTAGRDRARVLDGIQCHHLDDYCCVGFSAGKCTESLDPSMSSVCSLLCLCMARQRRLASVSGLFGWNVLCRMAASTPPHLSQGYLIRQKTFAN
jgi:hypothetical protein